MISSHDELMRLWDKQSRTFSTALQDLAKSRVGMGDYSTATSKLADLVKHTMILSNLQGRKRMLLESDALKRKAVFQTVIADTVSNVQFEEAVEDLVKREPRLADTAEELSRMYSTERVFGAVNAIDINMTKRVQEAIATLMQGGKATPSPENVLMEITPWTRSYAENVYQTNVATAYTQGRFEQARDPDVADIVPAMLFQSMDDSDTRPNHRAAHGLIAATNDVIWKAFQPPIGFRCFAPGTLVSAKASRALRMRYKGPICEIGTVNGRRLSVTVNHPVFTKRGWVSAGELREGDDLVCYGMDIESFNLPDDFVSSPFSTGRAVDNQDVPARIEDVFETLRVKGATSFRSNLPVLPLDFHGDAKWGNGYVDVVGSDGIFEANARGGSFKFPVDFHDMLSDGGPTFASQRGGDSNSRFNASGGPSSRNPRSLALSLNDSSVISTGLADLPLEYFSFGPASNLNAFSNEAARYNATADHEFLAQLQDAGPRVVAFDNVANVWKRDFDGHVYDLQTEGGWIVANGIYTSNCRCSTNFVSRFELERRGLIHDGRVTRYTPPGFSKAHPDEKFRVGAPGWDS